ncbi:MAG: alpha/beta fold hydrolase [Pseudorhodobacter sp.]
MARILLIHGSCHGAWCWRDVLPHLVGHDVRAIDLPGHGDDPTPASAVTLDLYAEAILDQCDGPTFVAGHSMAGYPISAAAERAPEKIARLTYVCAYLPRSGLSLADMRRAGPRQPLREAIEVSADGVTFSFLPDMLHDKLYHDCPEGTVDFAKPRLTPQPIRPQATPIALTDRFAAVPKRYIRCTEDRAIPPEYQADMAKGAAERFELPCAHSPFFAMPERLAALLTP